MMRNIINTARSIHIADTLERTSWVSLFASNRGRLSMGVLVTIFFAVFMAAMPANVLAEPPPESRAAGDWTYTGSMAAPRLNHPVALLRDGKVLVMKGQPEIYDPATGTFTPTENAPARHGSFSTATVLKDGRVLIAGGISAPTAADIYDPATGTFTAIGNLAYGHSFHSATLLNNGEVLIAGGLGLSFNPSSDAEIFDPKDDTFSSAGSLSVSRYGHNTALLKNGDVLIAGGTHIDTSGRGICTTTAEVYDAASGSFRDTAGGLVEGRCQIFWSDIPVLGNGSALIAGGANGTSAELYVPGADSFSPAGDMNYPRTAPTVTLLDNGKVLIAGGSTAAGPVTTNTSELYDPATGVFEIAASMNETRQQHAAVLLQDGTVLVTGGYGNGTLDSAEIFSMGNGPKNNTANGSMSINITTPADGATYDQGQELVVEYTCGGESGSGIVSCIGDVANGSSMDTGSLGTFIFTVTAVNKAGNEKTVVLSYTVVDVTDPVVTLTTPSQEAVYYQGQEVLANFTCTDEEGISGIVSCVGDVDNGDAVDTSTLGYYTFSVKAVDDGGNITTVVHNYMVADADAALVKLITPPEGATYSQTDVVLAEYVCNEEAGGSAIASCLGDAGSGAAVDTVIIGAHTFTVTRTNNIGETVTVVHNYAVADSTAPVAAIITPPEDAVYVQNQEVLAEYVCTDEDGGSGILSCVGTVEQGAAIDTSTVGAYVFNVEATDFWGNTMMVVHNYTVFDSTAPVVTIDTPAEGAIYDRGPEVFADYSCTDEDGGSGILSCVGTVGQGTAIDTSSAGTYTFSVTGTDNAGNTAAASHDYTVVVAPVVTIITPADGASYDHDSEVMADYSCTSEEGAPEIVSCVGDAGHGAAIDTSVSGDHTFTVTGTDSAGNTKTVMHSYNVLDPVAPLVTIVTPADGATYDHNSEVMTDYRCASEEGAPEIVSCVGDVDHGVAIDTSISGDHTFTVTGTDSAGNITMAVHNYTVLDPFAPVVTINTPPAGAIYDQNFEVMAGYSCTSEEGAPDIVSCVGDVDHGVAIDTSTPGDHTFTVTGADSAGNTTTVAHGYTVAEPPVTDSAVEVPVAPMVIIITPPDGAIYYRDQAINAEYCPDGEEASSTISCTGDVENGAAIDTSVTGSFTFSVTGTDGAEYTETVIHNYTVVDGTAPEVVIITPPVWDIFDLDEVILAEYSCTDEDGGSGIASCTGDVESGAAIDTSVLGHRTFTVAATDNNGNTTAVTHNYIVVSPNDNLVALVDDVAIMVETGLIGLVADVDALYVTGLIDLKGNNKLIKPLAKTLKALKPEPKKANKSIDKFLDKVDKAFGQGQFTKEERDILFGAVAGIRNGPTDDSIAIGGILTVKLALADITASDLTDRSRRKLEKELDKAIDKLSEDIGKACRELDKFLNEVDKLGDKITPEEAGLLIEGANMMKNNLGC